MPRATLSSRTLRNAGTGLDLSVPNYKEAKGLVTSTIFYQVVLASSLPCFKSPSHKDEDVVQFSIAKKLNEFEELRGRIAMAFSSTVLPPIMKKSIIASEAVLKERKNSLDRFLKFLAATPQMATCQPLLEFLGVDSVRAKKTSLGEKANQLTGASTQEEVKEPSQPAEEPLDGFFEKQEEEESDDSDDLFKENAGIVRRDEGSIFGTDDLEDKASALVFERPDLQDHITEEDERNLAFVPGGILSGKEIRRGEQEPGEDNSDLFSIQDDLDRLMTVDVGRRKKQPSVEEPSPKAGLVNLPSQSDPDPTPRPKPPAKPDVPRPKPPAKPDVPAKPKPPAKLAAFSSSSSLFSDSEPKPKIAPRSQLSSKPKSDSLPSDSAGASGADNLGQDDILKYLQANMESGQDADLFS